MPRELQPVARSAQYATWLLSLLGLGLSAYLTVQHYRHGNFAACPQTTLFNCEAVTTSAQSSFLGVPVAVLGLASYLFFTAINSPWAWRFPRYQLHLVRFLSTVGAMGFVLWLIAAELVIIGEICLYCTAVHAVTFALLLVLTRVSPAQLGWVRSATK